MLELGDVRSNGESRSAPLVRGMIAAASGCIMAGRPTGRL
jgi:hypothetical protein